MKHVHQGDLGDVNKGVEDWPYRPLPGEGVLSCKGLLFGAFRTFTAISLHCCYHSYPTRPSILLGIVPGGATEQIQPILEVVNLQRSVAFVFRALLKHHTVHKFELGPPENQTGEVNPRALSD